MPCCELYLLRPVWGPVERSNRKTEPFPATLALRLYVYPPVREGAPRLSERIWRGLRKRPLLRSSPNSSSKWSLLSHDAFGNSTSSLTHSYENDFVCVCGCQSSEELLLSVGHIKQIIGILRDFIRSPEHRVMAATISKLKVDLDFDSSSINQIHLILFGFQDAVSALLSP